MSVRNEVGELAYTFNHMSRELASYDRENRRLIAELEAGYLATLRSLASAIDAKDPSTRGHSERVAELAVAVGEELGLDEPARKALEYGGILHDIGKIGIPEAILARRARLAPDEMALVRDHPRIGAEIVRGGRVPRGRPFPRSAATTSAGTAAATRTGSPARPSPSSRGS